MNLETFSQLVKEQKIEVIKFRRNPKDINHWFPMIHCFDGSVHLLINHEDKEISKSSIEELVNKLKSYGAKKAEIIF